MARREGNSGDTSPYHKWFDDERGKTACGRRLTGVSFRQLPWQRQGQHPARLVCSPSRHGQNITLDALPGHIPVHLRDVSAILFHAAPSRRRARAHIPCSCHCPWVERRLAWRTLVKASESEHSRGFYFEKQHCCPMVTATSKLRLPWTA